MLSQNQSGFNLGDSHIYQLLSISHDICQPFDNDWEVRGVFIDILLAFDKVWHKDLIYKLKFNEMSWKFVYNNEQLEPLLLLIYITDLSIGI